MNTLDEIRAAVNALPLLEATGDSADWADRRIAIRGHLLNADAVDIDRFITWPPIQATMFVGHAPYINKEVEALKRDDWDRWAIAISDYGDFGATPMSVGEVITTGNAIHQAYHLMRWERASGCAVTDMDSIVEIGGGYGTMARIARQAGFSGRYTIYDLPEISMLQDIYFRGTGITDIETRHGFIDDECDLLIGLWSLSEMDPEIRAGVIGSISARAYALAYQKTWMGNDNLGWFRTLAKINKRAVLWKEFQIDHLPGNYYMFGAPR